jgi:GNAT superfamily N-acetyltransferase
MSLKGVSFEWQTKRLEFDTQIKPFKSEDDELNDFLFKDAKDYLVSRLAVTYLIETETETIAYFCLSNDNVLRDFDSQTTWRKLSKQIPNAKRRKSYPAVKIGRLAVTEKYAGNGFGRMMLNIAQKMYEENNQKSGCRFITVDAYQNAIDFYIRNKFEFLTTTDEKKPTRAMYFDLNNI